jgi:hypothetical protein
LFWTEEDSVFLACDANGKTGYATFKVRDAYQKEITINNSHFAPFQEKQMAFQPDFIGICSLPP